MKTFIPACVVSLLLVSGTQIYGAVDFYNVEWVSWTGAINPAPATGTSSYGTISVNVTGTHLANPAASSSVFSTTGGATFDLAAPNLGLGAPRANSITTYTIDLGAYSGSTSRLLLGISNLDATNGRGSLTVSAFNSANVPFNANLWATEAQFKELAGTPSAQSLVTRNELGDSLRLGSVQAPDNTAWGDSRAIFFSGLPEGVDTVVLQHRYNHPTPSVSDNISLYVAVIPEPATAGTFAAAGTLALAIGTRRRRTNSGSR